MNNSSKNSRFLSLFSKSQVRLYSFILMITHNDSDADEIFQETSIILWEKFDQFKEGTNFGAWAVSIAKIKVLEYLHKKKKDQLHFNDRIYQELAEIAGTESSNVNQRLQALRNCLYKLDRINRSLLSLRYQKNISIKAIAQRKGVSTGVMYRKLSKIFDLLRRCVHNTAVSTQ